MLCNVWFTHQEYILEEGRDCREDEWKEYWRQSVDHDDWIAG